MLLQIYRRIGLETVAGSRIPSFLCLLVLMVLTHILKVSPTMVDNLRVFSDISQFYFSNFLQTWWIFLIAFLNKLEFLPNE